MTAHREQWATRAGLVLAMAGNAVGLGNFLRFPAQAAQNGGGAFLIPYLVAFILMGIPLLWVEWAMGRHGGQFGHHSAPGILDRMGKSRFLKYIGVFGLFTNLTLAAYYCYIESWTLAYVWHSLKGTFRSTPPTEFFPAYLGQHAGSITALPPEATFFFVVTLALNGWILSRGLAKGIELAAKIGVPLLIVFGIILAARGLSLGPGDPGVVESPLAGLNFVWNPDLSGLADFNVWLAAAGQIFFTLSVGMGSIHCYASYVKKNRDVALNAASAGWMNEFVEVILGGTLLIPIATAYLGLAAVQGATSGGSGFALGFLTLPTLFNNWGWFAPVAGAMWFGLLFFAGITSSLAMGQPILSFLADEFGTARAKGALLFAGCTFVLGMWCVWLYPGGSFDEFDFWTGTFSLVVFALLEVIVFAWIFGMKKGWEEITRGADMKVPVIYRYIIPYVTPLFLAVVFFGALVQPEGGEWGAAVRGLLDGQGWPLSPGSVLGKLTHVGDAGGWRGPDGAVTPRMVKDLSRILLTLVFAACAVLVFVAFRKKERRAS